MSEGQQPVTTDERIRVALFQPALPKYRVPVFNALGALPDVELTLFPSPKVKGSSLPQAEGAESFEVIWSPMTKKGPFFFQPAQHTELKPGRFDVAVFSWNARNLDLPKALRQARRLGVGTVLWGHGFSKKEAGWRAALRNRLARKADALLFYNQRACDQLARAGFDRQRLFVAHNAIDQTPIQEAQRAWLDRPDELARFRREHDLEDRPAIIFVSRLEADNRLDWLLEAFQRATREVVEARLIIVGDGSARGELEEQARELGVTDRTTFTGAVYDENQLAPWMLSASAFCYPTNIGLSILHAFGYGLPVITSDALERQNPEIEALRPGENGLTWRHGDVDDLARQLARLLSDRDEAARLGEAARRTVLEHYTLGRMVEGFAAAIRFAARERRSTT
jgi:glycosyltransferase involved in cell wall biosynthesis